MISLTILLLINDVLAEVNKKTVSIPDSFLLVCAMAFSNSKSAGFRNPFNIKFASIVSLLFNEVVAWTLHEVADWIKSIGLESYSKTFIEEEITGKDLAGLAHIALKDFGFNTPGQRIKILRENNELTPQQR